MAIQSHLPFPAVWGVFDCTANNRKFAVGVGWCASNRTETSETDCKFPLQTVEAHFWWFSQFAVGENSTRNLRCNRIRPSSRSTHKFSQIVPARGTAGERLCSICTAGLFHAFAAQREHSQQKEFFSIEAASWCAFGRSQMSTCRSSEFTRKWSRKKPEPW